jgi:hypothetical protein
LSSGDCEIESRSLTGLRFHPDSAFVAFDDFLADTQSDSVTRVFVAGMQPLEDYEDSLIELRVDTDTIVSD